MNKSFFAFRTIISLGFIFLSSLTFAQEIKRIELPMPANSESYHTVPMGEKGVLLISQSSRNSYNVQRFDTNLERLWSIDGTIESNLEYITANYDGTSVFMLFSKYRSPLYQIVKVNVGPGFVETFNINTIDRFQITDFKTLGYSLFMAGTIRDEPILIHTDLASSQTKILPSAIKGSNAIQSIEIDPKYRLVNVSFAVRKGKQIRIMARSYDETGQLFSEVMVEPEDEYSLLNGRMQFLNDSTRLMIGTYGYRNMQNSTNTASQGMFISKIVYDEVKFTQYHSFTDFANFFSFMNDRQQEKMERRIRKKKEMGGDLKLNYRLLVHDIIPRDNQYVMVSEVFYPEYRSNNNNLMGMNSFYGNPFMFGSPFGAGLYNPYLWNPLYGSRGGFNQQIFDGFVYTHAIVAGFDTNGKLIWDNSINFESVKSMELKEKINVQIGDNGLTQLVYSQDGTIQSKVIKENNVIDGNRKVELPTGMEGDKVRKTTTDDVEYWYGNNYLAWGAQRIVNPAGDIQSRGRRNVFYLNKISL